MKRSLLLLSVVCSAYISASFAGPVNKHHAKTTKSLHTQQLLVVVTDGWDSLKGILYGFSRQSGKWYLKFKNPIVVGSKGLGMGDGIVPLSIEGAPVKHEGDKKSPAGIFSIGTAFGYADKKDARFIKNRYISAFDTLICVDDVHSDKYNTLVAKDTARLDYNSFEYMHRKDNYYKWGLFINHNSGKVTPGDGSCIFLHIWENDHEGTDGCTAMPEDKVLTILRWINARKHPLLVQLPKEEYEKVRLQFGLPELKS